MSAETQTHKRRLNRVVISVRVRELPTEVPARPLAQKCLVLVAPTPCRDDPVPCADPAAVGKWIVIYYTKPTVISKTQVALSAARPRRHSSRRQMAIEHLFTTGTELLPSALCQREVQPRSIVHAAPVMTLAASEQRYRARSATSVGSINRLIAAGSNITVSMTVSRAMPRVRA